MNNRKYKQTNPNKEALTYPFGFIGDDEDGFDYTVKDIVKSIIIEETPDVGNFPHNIKEYYWIHEGSNDCEDWSACGTLTNGLYFFFVANCDYTGFDCQGEMKLYVSKSFETLCEHGMGEKYYSVYTHECDVEMVLSSDSDTNLSDNKDGV